MESLDIGSLFEWAYDVVEKRWGRLAAWLVTLALVGVLAAGVMWVLSRLL